MSDSDAHAVDKTDFWNLLGVVLRWRRFIIIVTFVAATVSIVVSLLLPKSFEASTRLLPPESSGGSLATAVLGDLSSAAGALLGGASGNYSRFLAILTSRTVSERVVQEFDLVQAYETTQSETPVQDAIEILTTKVEFVIDSDYEFLLIRVMDRNPSRAASMANYYATQLNEVNNRLVSSSARNLRLYVQDRYDEATLRRDSLLTALQLFQERYGVFNLTAQTEAFFAQVAALRTHALQAEIEYEALRDRLGPENPQVASYGSAVSAARRKYQAALAGGEQILPVHQDTVPRVVREYAGLEMEKLIQERILEFVAPLLEQARFDERKTIEAVQVIDAAVPPAKKARPQRMVIVIMSTLSAALLATLFAFLMDWWSRNYDRVTRRVNAAMVRD